MTREVPGLSGTTHAGVTVVNKVAYLLPLPDGRWRLQDTNGTVILASRDLALQEAGRRMPDGGQAHVLDPTGI